MFAVGPLGGVLVALDRRVLRRQPEAVPADRVQHVVALLEPVAGDHVGQREDLAVAHVQVAGRVGEHVQQVAPFTAAVVDGAERVHLLPDLQPLFLRRLDVIHSALGSLARVPGSLCARSRCLDVIPNPLGSLARVPGSLCARPRCLDVIPNPLGSLARVPGSLCSRPNGPDVINSPLVGALRLVRRHRHALLVPLSWFGCRSAARRVGGTKKPLGNEGQPRCSDR